MYDEDDWIGISALQHVLFCETQCALIHVEGVWAENRLTAKGRILHERVHDGGDEQRDGVLIRRGLKLWSQRLGLTGVADVVELLPADPADEAAAELPGRPGRWRVRPVEYKRGQPKAGRCDEVQLCAQAMCLEEMLETRVDDGCLFYGKRRRRTDVVFDAALRDLTADTARRVHELVAAGRTPPPRKQRGCRNCSLRDACLPGGSKGRKSAASYVRRRVDAALADPSPTGDHDEDP